MKTYSKMSFLLVFLLFKANVVFPQWVQTDSGGSDVQCLIVNDAGIFVSTHSEGVFLSTDIGTSWTAVNTGLTNLNVQNLAASGSYLFAGTYGGGIFLSTNNGSNWTAVNAGLSNLKIYGLACSPPNVYAGTDGNGLFLSTNNGSSWTSAGFSNKTVGDIITRNSIVFAGVSYSTGGVYRSMDSCKSWTAVMNGVTDKNVLSLAVNGSNLYLGTAYNGLFLSTNNGDNWSNLNNGLTGDVWSIVFSNSNIFVGTGHGVYLSTDNGADWTDISTGLTNLFVLALAVKDNYLFAGCGNNGWVWKRPLSEMIGVINPIRQRGMLMQAGLRIVSLSHANPFVTIEFSLPYSTHVTVKIYDLSGREISSLVNNYLGSGSYSIPWNTRNIADGCYTVGMRAGLNTYSKSIPVFR